MAWKSASRLILCRWGIAPLDPAHPNGLAVGVFFDTHRLVAMDQHIRVVGVFMSTLSTSNLPSLPRHCTSTAGSLVVFLWSRAVFAMTEGFFLASYIYTMELESHYPCSNRKETFASLSFQRVSRRRSRSELSKVICGATLFSAPTKRAPLH